MEQEKEKKKESPTIREALGEDVQGFIYVKLKNKVKFMTIRKPVEGIQIVKTEYEIEKEDRR
jgi:hypothetical protein